MHNVAGARDGARHGLGVAYVAVANFDIEFLEIVPWTARAAERAYRISGDEKRPDECRSDKARGAGDHYESQRHRFINGWE